MNASIAARVSGRMPCHHAKVSAACSTSIPVPSANRRTPAFRASRKNGVSSRLQANS